jgi:hypothetical protein
MGPDAMNDADINFYFDPLCPFAWMTSKWVRQVAAQRDYTVDWRFISLRLINADVDYDSHFPAGYEAGHTAGLRLLRVAARTRAEHGRQAVGPLYEAIGTQVFDSDAATTLGAEERGSREFVEPMLEQAGLPGGLASALDDASWDGEVRAETDEALALTGKDVGTPIIHFGPPRGTAFSGRSSAGCRVTRRRSGCGTTSSGSPPSPASPSSSAACENGPSCAASASILARPASRRTGTAEAGASRNRTAKTLRGEHLP